MRSQIVVELPQRVGKLIEQGLVKQIMIKNDWRDITIKIIDNDNCSDEIEIETN